MPGREAGTSDNSPHPQRAETPEASSARSEEPAKSHGEEEGGPRSGRTRSRV